MMLTLVLNIVMFVTEPGCLVNKDQSLSPKGFPALTSKLILHIFSLVPIAEDYTEDFRKILKVV